MTLPVFSLSTAQGFNVLPASDSNFLAISTGMLLQFKQYMTSQKNPPSLVYSEIHTAFAQLQITKTF